MWLLVLLAITLATLYVWLQQHYSYWRRENVPYEEPLMFIGNMRGLGSMYHCKDIIERLYHKFKSITPIVGLYTFTTRAALILDLDTIKDVLTKDFKNFSDCSMFHNERDDPLTGNIMFVDGAKWRVLRHKLSPVFSSGKMKLMLPLIVKVSEKLETSCWRMFDTSEDIVEVKDLCARFTTDVIGTCFFGIDCNSLSDPEAELRKVGRSVFENPRHSALVQGFMFSNSQLARQFRMKNYRNEVIEFFTKMVQDTVEYRQKHNIKRNDYMDILIELKEQRDLQMAQGQQIDEDDLSSGLTLEQLTAQAVIFFLAGSDSSATSMAFCLYELALNPLIQERLRGEILQVLDKHDNICTYESLKEMKYLDMVLAETLRKYSITPLLMRICREDYAIANSDIVLKKNLRVLIPIDAIQRDPDYFPDPEKFDPDRFLPAECAKRHACSYLPFSDGPRNCIGLRFGKVQALVGLVALLKKYRFECCPQTQIPMRYSLDSLLISAESGVQLKVIKL